jgi:hypothetical protein
LKVNRRGNREIKLPTLQKIRQSGIIGVKCVVCGGVQVVDFNSGAY